MYFLAKVSGSELVVGAVLGDTLSAPRMYLIIFSFYSLIGQGNIGHPLCAGTEGRQ